jgi:excisionase family DNA binding protein
MNIAPPDRLVSIAEARKLLGVGTTTVYSLMKRGEIAARKIGARTVIPESSLRTFQERLPAARKTGGMR